MMILSIMLQRVRPHVRSRTNQYPSDVPRVREERFLCDRFLCEKKDTTQNENVVAAPYYDGSSSTLLVVLGAVYSVFC